MPPLCSRGGWGSCLHCVPVGVGVYVFAVFRGSGFGTAWLVGGGAYVFAVFSGSGRGTAWYVGASSMVGAMCSSNTHAQEQLEAPSVFK